MRTTIYLDDDTKTRLQRIVPPRGLNRFINQAVAEKIDALEREQCAVAMKEGYIATRDERREIDRDWAAVDVEGWPE